MTTKISHNYSVHIVYPSTKKTRELFLREDNHYYYHIERSGKTFGRPTINEKTREYLKEFGFSFKQESIADLVSKGSICDVHIDITKIKKGGKIKELLVRIPASGHIEASDKTKKVIDFVEEQTGIVGKPIFSHRVAC